MLALVSDHAAGGVALRNVAAPVPGADEVLVKVHAVSLNRGELRAVRAGADGLRPGWDFSGVIRDDPSGSLPEGARVVGIRSGQSWAEFVAVRRDWVTPLPAEVSFAQAAAIPVAGLTALRTLRHAPLLGRRVLLTGASGGVGRFLVQLARFGGADVTALVSEPARGHSLPDLGAHRVWASSDEGQETFDLIVDSVGGEVLGLLLRRLDPDGTLVVFGNSSNQSTTFNARDLYLDAGVRLHGFELFHEPSPFGRDLAFLVKQVASGQLRVDVAAELPWTRMSEALTLLEARGLDGKVVLHLD